MAIRDVAYGRGYYGVGLKERTEKELEDYFNYLQNYLNNANLAVNTTGATTPGYYDPQTYQRKMDEVLGEINRRKMQKETETEQQRLANIFAPSTIQGASLSPQAAPIQFDEGEYRREFEPYAQGQRRSLEDIFGARKTQEEQELEETYNPLRRQAIEDAAVYGNLRSPAFQSTILSDLGGRRARDAALMSSQRGQEMGQARLGIEQNLAEALREEKRLAKERAIRESEFGRGLGMDQARLNLSRQQSLAGLLSGESQFGRTQGMEREKFDYGRQQDALENAIQVQAMREAGELGRLQANAGKKSWIDDFGSVMGGVGNLAGGVGSLMGGFGAMKTGKALGGLQALNAGANLSGQLRQQYGQPIGPQPLTRGTYPRPRPYGR